MSRMPFRPRDAYRHWVPISTRWHDNDVYGHVNNVVYYSWFDTAVNSWLIQAGLLDVEHGDPIGLVVETGCRYATSVAFPQKVEVGLAIAHLGRTSVTYNLGIFIEREDSPVAEGHFTHVYVAREDRKPTPLPDIWRAAMEQLLG